MMPGVPPIAGWEIDARLGARTLPPILAEVDVLVVGGGAAGVAAATTAAERGRSVLLVERYGFCGGAAVAGMSGTICGLYGAADRAAAPDQLVFGFAERFRRALDARGGVTGPQLYGKTYTVTHDPLSWREAADDLLGAAGVRVLYHTQVVGVILEGDVFAGVVLESKAGRSRVSARRIVDASGDAAVVARGGYGFRFGEHGVVQNPTMCFRLGGVDVEAFRAAWGPDAISPAEVSRQIDQAVASGSHDLPRRAIWIFSSPRDGELLVNATRLTGPDGRALNPLDPADLTEAEIAGRRQVREYAAFLAERIPGLAGSYVVDTGVEVGVRQTRTVRGEITLTDEDVLSARKRSDSICRSAWPIEVHTGSKPALHWILDDYYDVPYGALIPASAEGVIVAGRCLSAEHRALASARVTAQCFEYGHAAGVAACLSLDAGVALRDVDVAGLRAEMIASGSVLDG